LAVDLGPRAAASLRWLPIALAGAYAVFVAFDLVAILHQIYRSSDTGAAGVLAQLLDGAPSGARVTLGDHPYFEEIAFMVLTRWLPFHRTVWYLAPVAFSAAGLGLFAWTAREVFGRWQAALAAAALVCVGQFGFYAFFAPDAHASTAIHAVILAAVLVWVIPRAQTMTIRQLSLTAVALGVLSGLPLAGDKLFLAWGMVPLIVATLLAAWRGPAQAAPRILSFGIGTAAIAGVVGTVFARLMGAAGFQAYAPALKGLLTFATPAGLAKNLGTFLHGLTYLAGGDFFGSSLTAGDDAAFLSGALVLAALVVVLLAVVRQVRAAGARPARGGELPTRRFVYTTFWATCLTCGIGMFLLGSPGVDPSAGRYLLGPYVAVAALLPLVVSQSLGWRLAVGAAVSVLALTASVRLFALPLTISNNAPSFSTAASLARFAAAEHSRYGYAYYWDAIDLTWASDFKVDVFPVTSCAKPTPVLCAFTEVQISSWYTPRRGVRSMLIVDPTWPAANARDPALGPPIASTTFGRLTAYVYPYDIAARLGR
jgi:hypothetical protein